MGNKIPEDNWVRLQARGATIIMYRWPVSFGWQDERGGWEVGKSLFSMIAFDRSEISESVLKEGAKPGIFSWKWTCTDVVMRQVKGL
jgi:hypothetical protein